MKKFIFLAVMLVILPFTLYADDYDVKKPHVIVNQFFADKNTGYMPYDFIELYNPTSEDVNLEGWAVHYRSSLSDKKYSDKWYKIDLSGDIPSRCSYLILCGKNEKFPKETQYNNRTITNYDILLKGGGGFTIKALL